MFCLVDFDALCDDDVEFVLDLICGDVLLIVLFILMWLRSVLVCGYIICIELVCFYVGVNLCFDFGLYTASMIVCLLCLVLKLAG